MAVVGLIPLVYAAIKRKRRTRRPDRYERISAAAAAARGAREHVRFNGGGAYQSQSCRFAVRPTADELAGYSNGDDGGGGGRTPLEDLSGELCSLVGRNERGLSRSLRFSSMRVLAFVGGA